MAISVDTLHGDHVRAARALLRLSTRALAAAIGPPVSADSLRNLENRPSAYMSDKGKLAVIEAFDRAGIKLHNSGKEGASWKEVRAKRPSIYEARKLLRNPSVES